MAKILESDDFDQFFGKTLRGYLGHLNPSIFEWMVFLGAPALVVSDFVVKSKIPEVTPYNIIVCP